MGTNYYAIMEETETECPHCERTGYIQSVRWHIGKSSHGWCFALHVGDSHEPHIPRSLAEWQKVWERCVRIEDEYKRAVTTVDMLKIVTERQGFPGADDKRREYDWYRSNSAEPGPNDLARHSMKYDSHCIGHGDGTYDLIKGVFS